MPSPRPSRSTCQTYEIRPDSHKLAANAIKPLELKARSWVSRAAEGLDAFRPNSGKAGLQLPLRFKAVERSASTLRSTSGQDHPMHFCLPVQVQANSRPVAGNDLLDIYRLWP